MKRLSWLLLFIFFHTLATASEQYPTKEEVAKLYVATFNRAPDSAGLNYWTNDSGLKLSEIAQSFFDQEETQTLYPSSTAHRDFIASVYQNLFNRDPDSAGWDYWEEQLNIGAFSKNRFIEAVMNGAQGDDATILSNKAQVGMAFANAGLEDVEHAKNVMSGVSHEASTVTVAQAEIEGINSAIDEGKVTYVSTVAEFRQALEDAALNGQNDTIKLVAGIYKTTSDSIGTFAFSDHEEFNLTIIAADGLTYEDVILDGDHTDQVFNYNSTEDSTLRLKNISVVNGQSMPENNRNVGGVESNRNTIVENSDISHNTAIHNGTGGLYSSRNTTIINSTISDNNSTIQGIGGLASYGKTTIISSHIVNNHSTKLGAGGFYSSGNVILIDSTISNNSAEGDSGGFEAFGMATIDNSVISHNISNLGAGGFSVRDIEILNSTISYNQSNKNSGGFTSRKAIINNATISDNIGNGGGGFFSTFETIVSNSTISNNVAKGDGGGFYAKKATIINSKVSNNSAGVESGAFEVGHVTIVNSILLNNSSQGGCSGFSAGKSELINSLFVHNTTDDLKNSFCSVGYSYLSNNNFIGYISVSGGKVV